MEDASIDGTMFTAMYLKNSENAEIEQPRQPHPDHWVVVGFFSSRKRRMASSHVVEQLGTRRCKLVADREVWAMTGWEPIVYTAQSARHMKAYYAVPRKGYEGWGNNTDLARRRSGSRSLSVLRMRFVNGWLRMVITDADFGALRGYMRANRPKTSPMPRPRRPAADPAKSARGLRGARLARPSLPARSIGKTRAPTILQPPGASRAPQRVSRLRA